MSHLAVSIARSWTTTFLFVAATKPEFALSSYAAGVQHTYLLRTLSSGLQFLFRKKSFVAGSWVTSFLFVVHIQSQLAVSSQNHKTLICCVHRVAACSLITITTNDQSLVDPIPLDPLSRRSFAPCFSLLSGSEKQTIPPLMQVIITACSSNHYRRPK